MSVLQRWGAFAANLGEREIPAHARGRLRAQVASVLAAAFAAELDDEARRVTTWAKRSVGPHPWIPGGDGVARFEALVASAARASAIGWDDHALASEPGAAAVIVPLVLGAAADLAWSSLECAQAAAVELAGRVGLATWLTGAAAPSCAHRVGAAVAASRVLGLDEEKTRHAIALAWDRDAIDAAGDDARDGRGRAFSLGTAIAGGVIAAELAFEGVEGGDAPSAIARAPAGALDRLGTAWIADTVHVKEHPAEAWLQTAIDAAIEVAGQGRAVLRRPLSAAEVSSVTIETTQWCAIDAAFGEAEITADSLRRSIAHAVAATLVAGDFAPLVLDPRRLSTRSAEIAAMLARVHVEHAWALTSETLWSVANALDRAEMIGAPQLSEVVQGVSTLFRPLGARASSSIPIAQRVSDGVRAALRRRAPSATPTLEGASIPFGVRIRAVTKDGAPLGADRTHARGAPGRSIEEAIDLARTKLVAAASPTLGSRRAGKLAAMVLEPSKRLRVREVIEAMKPG